MCGFDLQKKKTLNAADISTKHVEKQFYFEILIHLINYR